MFAKFYEILSLPFQDIEKPKHRVLTNKRTDGRENSIPTHKHSLRRYNKLFTVGVISSVVELC